MTPHYLAYRQPQKFIIANMHHLRLQVSRATSVRRCCELNTPQTSANTPTTFSEEGLLFIYACQSTHLSHGYFFKLLPNQAEIEHPLLFKLP